GGWGGEDGWWTGHPERLREPMPLGVMPTPTGSPILSMPLVARPGAAPAQPVGEGRAELPAPPADGLVAHHDPALSEHLLHVPVAEEGAGIQPPPAADEPPGGPAAVGA